MAVVDSAAFLVYFERMDNTQLASVQIAIDKARSAALFRRPTKVFQDLVHGGNLAVLALHGAKPLEGGVPLIAGGKLVGAIGVSGGTPAQDSQCAQTGAAVLK